MNIFEKIKNDEEIIRLYNNISKYEDLNKGWAHHDYNHVSNVAQLVGKLLSLLGYDSDFIMEAKIAAILHDTGCIQGKEEHALRSYEYAKDYLIKNNINLKYKDLVLDAIRLHSDGFDTDNIMALTIILCDKLDIKYTRVATEGYNIIGMRQYQYIKDILINIYDNTLEINFTCDKDINKEEMEEYYFTKKVFKAIITFSNKLSLTPRVLFNNKDWDILKLI